MMLDKRKCRAYAVPDRKLSPANGILHVKQISYIVITAVKNIAHHRTLILYVYSRDQAVRGDCKPLWTMFHTKDNFLTLARKEDGSTTWRTASFDRLYGNTYNFSSQCAFYSNLDEKRVQHYFKSDTDGFQALTAAQDAILEHRRKEHQITREKAVIARMEGIPALPRGLASWIKSIMPAYFSYDYRRGSRDIPGICSACGHEITLPGIKQGNKAICPHCKHELVAKPRSRRGCCMYDRETFEVIQNMGDGRLVVRIIKAYYSYRADTPEIDIYENARQFIWQNTEGEICTEHYYYSYNSGKWKKGERPMYIMYQYHFEGDTCGHLYTKNLPEALAGTPWQYCTIANFYSHFRQRIQVLLFLRAHIEHPRLEYSCKMGFYNIASDLAYSSTTSCLDETQNRTHRILRVAPEDINFLHGLDVDMATLKTFQKYSDIKDKDRQQLLVWQLANNVKHNILPVLKYITVHKLIRYTEKQLLPMRSRKGQYGCIHYQKMQDIVTDYRDYLEMCDGLNYDMKNSFVLYPKNLWESHDRVQKRFKIKESTQLMQDFKAAVQDVKERMAFEAGGMKIVVPVTPRELEAEGNALHHCVGRGSYADRVAKKECMILFVRKCNEIDKPYYTVEIRGQEAIQVRGIGNCAATPEVQSFIDAFQRQVLQGVADNAA